MSSTGNIERRAVVELRVAGRKLEGYAATFGTEATVGTFTEMVARGAFANSLAGGNDILALLDHDPGRLLGRTKTGTLALSEDHKGLRFSLDLPDTSTGRDVLALAERGDLGGMSFGFRVPEGGDAWDGNRRELRHVDLREVSVVSSWPAYEGTTVAARARTRSHPRLTRVLRFMETVK